MIYIWIFSPFFFFWIDEAYTSGIKNPFSLLSNLAKFYGTGCTFILSTVNLRKLNPLTRLSIVYCLRTVVFNVQCFGSSTRQCLSRQRPSDPATCRSHGPAARTPPLPHGQAPRVSLSSVYIGHRCLNSQVTNTCCFHSLKNTCCK
jgi:hypothetical protein